MKDDIKETIEMFDELQKNAMECIKAAPEGQLRCGIAKGRYPQYYFVEKSASKRRFIKKEEMKLAYDIAQKEYAQAFLKELEIQRRALTNYDEKFDLSRLKNIYEKLPEAKKILVSPFIMPDEEYIKRWEERYPDQQNPIKCITEHITEKGEVVKSKSEKMIADKLFYKNIPYRYEPELWLKGYGKVYPDFAVLNVRKRKTYFWEHFGMLGDADYLRKNLLKMDAYENNGIFQGTELLVTMESADKPVNMKNVGTLIDRFLT